MKEYMGLFISEIIQQIALYNVIMPPFEEKGVCCFANVGRSVGRRDGFRRLS